MPGCLLALLMISSLAAPSSYFAADRSQFVFEGYDHEVQLWSLQDPLIFWENFLEATKKAPFRMPKLLF